MEFISVLRCTDDGAPLTIDQDSPLNAKDGFILDGKLCCGRCSASYAVECGILTMLKAKRLDDESKHEQELRNITAMKRAEVPDKSWFDDDYNIMEMKSTFKALSVCKDHRVLELGCGDGRYTVALANQCHSILAVDFSLASLQLLQSRLPATTAVGLILGDVSSLNASAGFDRVLSTLVSNLPTRDRRDAMYKLSAAALKPNGRFVFSVHHQGIRQRLCGEQKSGRYSERGIYRYQFYKNECMDEVRAHFRYVKVRGIQIHVPFAQKLRLPAVALSTLLEGVPLINYLGDLLLCVAEQAIQDS